MAKHNGVQDSQLSRIPGLRAAVHLISNPITCPLCASSEVIHLTGKISFEVTMSGEDLFEGEPQSLAAFVCALGHVFFLRERDVFALESVQESA